MKRQTQVRRNGSTVASRSQLTTPEHTGRRRKLPTPPGYKPEAHSTGTLSTIAKDEAAHLFSLVDDLAIEVGAANGLIRTLLSLKDPRSSEGSEMVSTDEEFHELICLRNRVKLTVKLEALQEFAKRLHQKHHPEGPASSDGTDGSAALRMARAIHQILAACSRAGFSFSGLLSKARRTRNADHTALAELLSAKWNCRRPGTA